MTRVTVRQDLNQNQRSRKSRDSSGVSHERKGLERPLAQSEIAGEIKSSAVGNRASLFVRGRPSGAQKPRPKLMSIAAQGGWTTLELRAPGAQTRLNFRFAERFGSCLDIEPQLLRVLKFGIVARKGRCRAFGSRQ